jgi:hypothetical protein
MLKEMSFVFKNDLFHSVEPYMLGDTVESRGDIITIGIHSRHIRSNNNGTDIHQEVKCMDMLLHQQRRDPTQPCKILIMADRKQTLDNLAAAAEARNCEAIVVEKEEVAASSNVKEDIKSAEDEHGPFRGRGFFRDWLVVKQATSGYIHYEGRSSSAIVYENMVYDAMTQGFVDEPIPRCAISWKVGRQSEQLVLYGKNEASTNHASPALAPA